MKLSFLVAICLSIALLITTLMIWVVLSSLGIINDLDALFAEILGEDALSLAEILSLGQVMFFASIVAVLNAVGGTVLGAVSALIYNLSVKLTGGLLVGFTNN